MYRHTSRQFLKIFFEIYVLSFNLLENHILQYFSFAIELLCMHMRFLGWQWKQYRKLHHPSFWVCDNHCKSGCGGDLATYSHCNLAADVNHNGIQENGSLNGYHNGEINGVINGNHQNGLSNGVLANGHSEVNSCPFK